MSVINRKPLINEILSGLNSTQLADLKKCINGQGGSPIFRSLKPISTEHLTTADYGVKPIQLELQTIIGGQSVYEGYLIFTASMCYVICYSGDANQVLSVLKVNTSTQTAEFINGALSILELRSELDDEAEISSELPATTEAAEGDVLVLNSNKKPVWGEPGSSLPSMEDASVGSTLVVTAAGDNKIAVWGSRLINENVCLYSVNYSDGLEDGVIIVSQGIMFFNSPLTLYNTLKQAIEGIASTYSIPISPINSLTTLNAAINTVFTAVKTMSAPMAYVLISTLSNFSSGALFTSSKAYTLIRSGEVSSSSPLIYDTTLTSFKSLDSLLSDNQIAIVSVAIPDLIVE